MESKKFPWIPTEEYLKMLREDPRFVKVEGNVSAIVGKDTYNIAFLQNLKWFQEENGYAFTQKVHCFQLIKEAETEEYLKHVPRGDKVVYLLFEEDSRYTYSNSPRLFIEERLKQGVQDADVLEGNNRYLDYLDLLNSSFKV